MMHMMNVSGYDRRNVFGFGMVSVRMHLIGHVYTHQIVLRRVELGKRHKLFRTFFILSSDSL